MYYSIKLPEILFDSIQDLFSQCQFVNQMFQSKEVEFIREAVRMNIANYRQQMEKIQNSLYEEPDYGPLKSSSIHLPKDLYNEIQELYYDNIIISRRFEANKARFIRESIERHTNFWFDICRSQKNNI